MNVASTLATKQFGFGGTGLVRCSRLRSEETELVAFDDDLSYLRNEGMATPVFTVLRSSVREAGRYVSRILLSQIAQSGTPPQNHMMVLELIQGTSTGPFKGN